MMARRIVARKLLRYLLIIKENNLDNFRLIHKENGGVSSARNAGMKYATGELFSFIDSDD